MNRLPSLKEFEKREEKRIRLIFLFAAFGLPSWGAITHFVYPEHIDPTLPRFLILILFLLLYLVFNKIPEKVRQTDVHVLLPALVITGHGYWVAWANQFHVHHALGSAITISLVYTGLKRFSSAALFTVSFLVLTLLFEILQPYQGNVLLPLFWFSTILTAGLLANLARYSLMSSMIQAESEATSIVETMYEGVVVHKQNGEILYANPVAPKILGLTVDQMLGKTNADPMWKTTDESGITIPFDQHPSAVAQATGKIVKAFPMVVNKPSGEKTHLSITAVPLFDNGSSAPSRVVVTFQDVTEIKQAQNQILEQQAVIAHSSRMSALGEMAGSIAHEINTPLTTIGMSATLAAQYLSVSPARIPEAISNLERIQNTVQRIDKIIRSMRILGRSKRQEPLEHTTVDKIVDLVLDLGREKILSSGVNLQIEIPANLKVSCRPVQIAQVLMNLINNAVDALEGVKEKSITVTARDADQCIEIAVSDSGPGVPENLREKILQPFFTTKTVGRGIGLGLSISRKILQDHRGQLSYLPVNNVSRFVITLPKVA